MTTKAIASVDRWLEEADAVLAEAREASLSPSTATASDDRHEWTVPLAELTDGLAPLLDHLCSRPGRWILIVEDAGRPDRYWQAIAFEDGSLVAEATSATYGSEDERHDPATEAALVGLDWHRPAPPGSPNWRRVEATVDPDVHSVAEQAVRTLRDAFAVAEDAPVHLTLFHSGRRERTPASEPDHWAARPDAARPERTDAATGGRHQADGPLAPSFVPTDEPWAEWYRQLWPGHTAPRSPWVRYCYASSAVSITRSLWEERRAELATWTGRHGSDPARWPVAHPPAVLFMAGRCWAACLGCTFVAGGVGDDEGQADAIATAVAHAEAHGADRETLEAQGVPVHPGVARRRQQLRRLGTDEPDGPLVTTEQTWS